MRYWKKRKLNLIQGTYVMIIKIIKNCIISFTLIFFFFHLKKHHIFFNFKIIIIIIFNIFFYKRVLCDEWFYILVCGVCVSEYLRFAHLPYVYISFLSLWFYNTVSIFLNTFFFVFIT